jgi:hypothetical protein
VVSPEDPAAAGPTLHMILKADESWRPCGDYRLLNCSQPRTSLVWKMQAGLHGCRIFSKLDLPVQAQDSRHIELLDFICMLFSPKNARQTFPGLLDRAGKKLDFVFFYLENILVASCDKQSNPLHLQQILERFPEYGLVFNSEKCEFGWISVNLWGHRISAAGIEPLVKHVQAVQDFTCPVC